MGRVANPIRAASVALLKHNRRYVKNTTEEQWKKARLSANYTSVPELACQHVQVNQLEQQRSDLDSCFHSQLRFLAQEVALPNFSEAKKPDLVEGLIPHFAEIQSQLATFKNESSCTNFRRLMKLPVSALDELLENLEFTHLLRSKKNEKATALLPLFNELEPDIEEAERAKRSHTE